MITAYFNLIINLARSGEWLTFFFVIMITLTSTIIIGGFTIDLIIWLYDKFTK